LKQLLLKQFCASFIVLIAVHSSTFAAQPQQADLGKISAKIADLKKALSEKQDQKISLSSELQTLEQQISETNTRIYQVNSTIKQQNKLLKPLLKQQQVLQDRVAKQRADLAKQMQAAYQMGQQNFLELLLSQEDPTKFSRISMYYQSVNRARELLIQQFLQSLQQVQENQQAINGTVSKLTQLRASRVSEQGNLKQKESSRKKLIVQTNSQIKTQQQRIRQLELNKEQLQNVINQLNTQKQYGDLAGVAFDKLRGRLPWPVQGRITRDYGQTYDTRLISNGIFITAAANSPVHAVATGQVIFANWLRGYGNLLIVSHTGGYMTLYAHNDALFKHVGDMVQPGEAIALVGNSGGLATPGLYFEIRYQGKTRDPNRWCRGRP
jgi:septal ring factor EnvC (AmiA/AmiB activator)